MLKGLHVVSAWSCANGISLGQLKVDGKSNEITALPEIISQLTLNGAIVTIDAMGCQKEIATQVHEHSADYLIGLKGNQSTLYEGVRDCFDLKDPEYDVSTVKDEIGCEQGRIEERTLEVLDAQVLEGLVDLSEWSVLTSIAKMTYTRETQGKRTSQTLYYISSLSAQDHKKLLHAIRSHWRIESMHWTLDVTFREDECRVRDETTALNLNITS